MKFCLTALILCCGLYLQAQTQVNLEQLVDMVRSELAMRQSTDKQMAAEVRKLQLTEKLTDKVIIDLQAQGAGPKTVEALKELRDKTKDLKPVGQDLTSSPATAPDNTLIGGGTSTATLGTNSTPTFPPPDSVTQQKILDSMKQYAENYTNSLPNFMCVEVVRQFADPRAQENYRSLGTILAKVGYRQGEESYQVYSINGKLANPDTSMGDLHVGGATSTGEFGSLMREIFDPKSDTEFNWDHWGTLRGRRMAVFSYSIDSGHSSWSISYGSTKGQSGDEQRIITAYQGLVYADPDTGEVDRIKFVAVNIPRTFPVKATNEQLDYDLVDISGQKYVVPLAAKLWMKGDDGALKNEIEFRGYRKFGTDYNIQYELGEAAKPLPAEKTQEAPTTQKPTPAAQKAAGPWDLPTAPPPPPQ
jgi:hypothetical protein